MTTPEPQAAMVHFTPVELRFNDFDMLGHLNNASFFEITDLAKARFMEWLLGGEVDWRHFDVAIVNIDCSFYAQVFPDDRIGVRTGVRKIGEHSFTIEQRVVDCDSDKVFAVSCSVFCAFDRSTLHAKPIPSVLREALERVVSIL